MILSLIAIGLGLVWLGYETNWLVKGGGGKSVSDAMLDLLAGR